VEGGARGEWRVTPKGFDFVDGKIAVPKSMKVLKKEVQVESTEQVTIVGALRDRYFYSDLMRMPLGEKGLHAGVGEAL
jgi:hypothetical protein